jgi:hypothetical protein
MDDTPDECQSAPSASRDADKERHGSGGAGDKTSRQSSESGKGEDTRAR